MPSNTTFRSFQRLFVINHCFASCLIGEKKNWKMSWGWTRQVEMVNRRYLALYSSANQFDVRSGFEIVKPEREPIRKGIVAKLAVVLFSLSLLCYDFIDCHTCIDIKSRTSTKGSLSDSVHYHFGWGQVNRECVCVCVRVCGQVRENRNTPFYSHTSVGISRIHGKFMNKLE